VSCFHPQAGEIVKNGWISTRLKLEDPMTKQMKDSPIWNLGHEQSFVLLFLCFLRAYRPTVVQTD